MRKKALADWIKQNFWLFGLLLALFALSACEIPNAMSVRAGLDPKYVDDHVRFRARYYYTVIEHCGQDGKKLPADKQNITLYRYTLTGKAPSLFSTVKFEAGLMPTEIVEKFGTKLRDNGELQEPGNNGAKIVNVDQMNVTQMTVAQMNVGKMSVGEKDTELSNGVLNSGKPNSKDNHCYDEIFISGPEGTIRDDDTQSLVLSMTTSASPLIESLGALNNLATSLRGDDAKMMDSVILSNYFKSEKIIAQQAQLILLREKNRMAKEGAPPSTPDQVEGMMRSICAALEEGAGQCPDPQ